MKLFTVVYFRQEGKWENGKFVVQKNKPEKYTVFANSAKDAEEKFSKETGVGKARINEVKETQGQSNMVGDLCPALFNIKFDEESKIHEESK